VALLKGCVQTVLRPEINDATIRLLGRHGVEVVILEDTNCCGALSHHLGEVSAALTLAKANIAAWAREIDGRGLDAIIVNASGCGTMIKDYGFLLRGDAAFAERAAKVSALCRDVSELLEELEIPRREPTGVRVAYQSPCSLQHGQRVKDQPKALLRAAGFTVLDVPEGHLCCGSAGVYNILQAEIARDLRDRKVANIARTHPDVIATSNIGCLTQIAGGTTIPVVHMVELLDWATGGPNPLA